MLTTLLFFALAAAPAQSPACDRAALARAEASVLDAQARFATAADWGAQNRALALVAAARDQLAAATALCAPTKHAELPALASPFETADAPDPFEPEEDAAYLLVCGSLTVEECAGLDVPAGKAERW